MRVEAHVQLSHITPNGRRFVGRLSAITLVVLLVAASFAFMAEDPSVIWWTSWISSLFLLATTLCQNVFSPPADRPWKDQVLRPWILLQTIFVGYNCLSSLFYWADINGYYYFTFDPGRVSTALLPLAASAQRLYFLGHMGLIYGIAFGMRGYWGERYQLRSERELSTLLLKIAVLAAAGILIFSVVPGLSQFSEKMRSLATVSAAVSLGIAYRERKPGTILLPAVANAVLFLLALSSGWKSEVVVLVLLNASVFFATMPVLTTVCTTAILVAGACVLPPLANKIRQEAWTGEEHKVTAVFNAVDAVRNRSWKEIQIDTWAFLTQRLSEEGMFVGYISVVPDVRPYYGTEILSQAAATPMPRVLWPDKPDIELAVRERVLEAGIVKGYSLVSAKPQTIVDGYLSFGAPGVLIVMLAYGIAAGAISRVCERYMGGYMLGGVVFNGLFGILWTGNCLEFLANGVFWSLILLYLLFCIARASGVLVRAS